MKASDSRAPGAAVVAIIGGSLAGVIWRWAAGYLVSTDSAHGLIATLVVSASGGVILGALLGATIHRRSAAEQPLLITSAPIASIATVGAAATLDMPPDAGPAGAAWRDVIPNVGAAILAAGAGAIVARRWRRS